MTSVAEAYALDNMEDNRVLIHMHSVDEYPGVEIKPAPSGVVRASIRVGGFLVEALSHNSCRCHMMFNVDPKVYCPSTAFFSYWFTI